MLRNKTIPETTASGTPAVRLFSCDIFDTLLTRVVGSPASVFLLLGRRLAARGLIRCSPEAFQHARREAASRARINGAAEWPVVTLSAIYREMQFRFGMDDATRDAVMAEELALEAELLRPVPGARERLQRARQAGDRVAFLSDMYLDSTLLRGLLQQHDLSQNGDRVYVSCELGCGKAGGGSYRLMSQRESVAPGSVVHRGNDPRLDVLGAREAGVRSEPFPEGNLNRFEEMLEAYAAATDGLSSVMAGAARLARLQVPASTPREAALRDVAASVGGPAIASYVLWILLRAQAMRVRRLYFMARDGHIMLEMARRIAPALGLEIELKYLHGGRQAWFNATILETAPTDLFWAVDYGARDTTLAGFLARLDLAPSEIEEELAELGFPRETWDAPQAAAGVESLWAVPRHPPIRERLLQQSAARRAEVLGYFADEGLLQDDDWAVVDVGWSGRVLGAMNRILETRGGHVPAAFFFARAVDHVDHALRSDVPVHAWFSDYVEGTGMCGRVKELYLELFCGASQGVTTGFERVGGRHRPVHERDNPPLDAWGLAIVHDSMTAFADHLWLGDGVLVDADMRPAVADVLEAFVRTPSESEAAAWGAYPFEYGRTGVVTASIAEPYTARHALQALRNGYITTRSGTQWTQASMARTPRATRFLLRACLGARLLAGHMRRSMLARAARFRGSADAVSRAADPALDSAMPATQALAAAVPAAPMPKVLVVPRTVEAVPDANAQD
jgi:FMN phosphatase YigB (HAD superfamily)